MPKHHGKVTNQRSKGEGNFQIKSDYVAFLVNGFNPSEKNARQIGSFPQGGVKITHI